MEKNSILLSVTLFFILFYSCSINYDENMLPEKMMENIPDNVLYNFIYTENENGHKSFSIYADKAEIFDKKQQTILTGVVFQQFNKDNVPVSEGRSDTGIIFTENNNAELTGNLKIYSSSEETELETSYLYWDNDKKTLTGKPDKKIRITKDSGTVITGKGFTGDMKTKIYFLNSEVTGEYVYEEE